MTRFDVSRVEISLILEGSVRFTLDGKVREQQGPCATIQAYRQNLTVQAPPDVFVRTMWCHFSPEVISGEEWRGLISLPPVVPIPSILPALFSGALDVQSETPGQGDIAQYVTNSLGRTILAEYIRTVSKQFARGPFPKAVKAAKVAIDANPFSPWTLQSLAEAASTSPSHLIHLFNTYLDKPPIHYVWERRLDAAVQLLQTTDTAIDQIAYRCGFLSPAHFSRRVKAKYGRSPRELRN